MFSLENIMNLLKGALSSKRCLIEKERKDFIRHRAQESPYNPNSVSSPLINPNLFSSLIEYYYVYQSSLASNPSYK